MSRGHPDWNVNVDWYSFFDIDSAELAARLGSVVTFNRSGRVVHIDKCTHDPITWEVGEFGTGASVVLDSTKSFRHQTSIKLIAGSDGVGRAAISKNMPVIQLSQHGIEFTWSPSFNAYIVALAIIYFDGTNSYTFIVRCDMNAQTLKYWSSGGAYVDFATITDLAAKTKYWHITKLVVDLVNFEYVKFYLDDTEYDLADIAGQESADSATPHIEISVYHQGAPSGNPYIHVNDFIFTMDEP